MKTFWQFLEMDFSLDDAPEGEFNQEKDLVEVNLDDIREVLLEVSQIVLYISRNPIHQEIKDMVLKNISDEGIFGILKSILDKVNISGGTAAIERTWINRLKQNALKLRGLSKELKRSSTQIVQRLAVMLEMVGDHLVYFCNEKLR